MEGVLLIDQGDNEPKTPRGKDTGVRDGLFVNLYFWQTPVFLFLREPFGHLDLGIYYIKRKKNDLGHLIIFFYIIL